MIGYLFIGFIKTVLINERKKYFRDLNKKNTSIIYDEAIIENAASNDLKVLEQMSKADIQAIEEFIIDFHLSNVIEELSPKEKKLIYMRFVEGQKDPAVAKELGISSQAVSKMRRKLLKKIADNYSPRE